MSLSLKDLEKASALIEEAKNILAWEEQDQDIITACTNLEDAEHIIDTTIANEDY